MQVKFWRKPSFPEDEFSAFVATAKQAFLCDNPNPGKKGCPDRQLLIDLAFRRADKNSAMKVTLHLRHCSNCFQEVSNYLERYNSQRALRLKVAVAAGIALIIAASLFLQNRFRKPASVPQVGQSPSQRVEPETNQRPSDGTQIARVETALLVVDYIMVSPTRGAKRPKIGSESLVLQGRRLRLRIHLPLGSEAGKYEVRLHRKSDKTEVMKVYRNATKENNYILVVEEDFGKFPPGDYLLAVFPPGWKDEVQAHPVRIVSSPLN
jgi:hypothetical protein